MVNKSNFFLTTATFIVAGSTFFTTTADAAFIKHRIPAKRHATLLSVPAPANLSIPNDVKMKHSRLRRQAGASGYCRKRSQTSSSAAGSNNTVNGTDTDSPADDNDIITTALDTILPADVPASTLTASTATTTGDPQEFGQSDNIDEDTTDLPVETTEGTSSESSCISLVDTSGSSFSIATAASTSDAPSACTENPSLSVCSDSPIATTLEVATSYIDITVTSTVSANATTAAATSTTQPSAVPTSQVQQHFASANGTSIPFLGTVYPSSSSNVNATSSIATQTLSSSVTSSINSGESSATSFPSSDANNNIDTSGSDIRSTITNKTSSSKTDGTTSSTGSSASMTSLTNATNISTTTSMPSATPICPAGSTWKLLEDDFTKQKALDTSRWSVEDGAPSHITFGADGMFMKLDQKNTNIVLQSRSKWLAPLSMTASIQSARAPGVISCMIFGQAKTDEIDLELVEGTWQVPLWKDGKRLEPNQDVTYSIAEDSHEHAPWVFSDKQMVPFAKVHDWKLTWEKERLTWSADNRLLLDVVRKDKGLWPTEALPLRWGPWATDAGWAGPLNWTKTPEAVMQLKSVKIEGCQLD